MSSFRGGLRVTLVLPGSTPLAYRLGRRRGGTGLAFVRLPQPVGNRRLDFVTMGDAHEVGDLRLRRPLDPADLRRLDRALQEDTQLQMRPVRANVEVAGPPREHDRLVGRIDPLLAEFS